MQIIPVIQQEIIGTVLEQKLIGSNALYIIYI
jgi:hypothetical protein